MRAVALALALGGCAPRAEALASIDDAALGEATLARLRTWFAAPRGLGDPARAASIDALERALSEYGETYRDDFTAADPQSGARLSLTNLFVDVRPAAPRRFVLATHFDTRPWADESSDPALHHKPVPGANDGTSGLAVILELAPRLVAALPDDIGFSIALFDGEELGRPEVGGYCAGSRRLVDVIDEPRYATLRAASFGIVLDMVGDADLQLRREPYSERAHPALVDHLWRTAARGGYDSFERAELPAQLDDHVYLSRAGVPSVLLLDRDYPAWHTTEDTLERVSARSLGTVGAVVLAALLSYPWPDDDAGPRGAAARGR